MNYNFPVSGRDAKRLESTTLG